MSLLLLQGPAASGKTHLLIEKVLSTSADKALVLVPTQQQADDWQERYCKQNPTQVVFGNPVLSFHRFHEKFFPELKHLSKRQSTFLCSHLLKTLNLRSFPATQHSLTLARQLAEMLHQFLVYQIQLEELKTENASWLAKDIATLFKAYQQYLAEQKFFRFKILKEIPAWLKEKEFLLFDEWHSCEPYFLQTLQQLKKMLPSTRIIMSYPSWNAEKPYAWWLEKQFSALQNIADEHQMLFAKESFQPTISLVSVASPSEEARLLAQSLIESMPHQELSFCLRHHSPLHVKIAEELSGLDSHHIFPLTHQQSALLKQIEELDFPLKNNSLESWQQWLHKQKNIFSFSQQTLLKNQKTRAAAAQYLATRQHIFTWIQDSINEVKNLGLNLQPREIHELLVDNAMRQQSTINTEHFGARTFNALPVNKLQTLHIPELTHEQFPKKARDMLWKKDPFLSSILSQNFPPHEALAAEELFLFENWIQKTEHEVILSYAQLNDEAREQAPSSFVAPFFPAAQIRPKLFLRHNTEGDVIKSQSPQMKETHALAGYLSNPQTLIIIHERLQEKPLSASDLEKFIECPYAYFVERILRVRSQRDTDHELRPQDRGTMLHKLLEKFYQKYHSKWKIFLDEDISEEKLLPLIKVLAEELVKTYAREWKHIPPSMQEHSLSILCRAVAAILLQEFQSLKNQNQKLLPHTFEWSFGFENNPFEIKLPSGRTLKLCGKVDRIDVDQEKRSFLILDYKTGKNLGSITSKIKSGKHLQLPLYFLAAQKKFLPEATGLGGMIVDVPNAQQEHGWVKKESSRNYFKLSSPRKAEVKEDEWDEQIQRVLEVCDESLQKMEEGNFQTQEVCEHCKNAGFCRYQRE